MNMLQQSLPFTVLKHTYHVVAFAIIHVVATAPTVLGIETPPISRYQTSLV